MPDLLESPIIFLGFGRSGTTIISNIIFEHPKLAWVSNYQEKFPKYRSINFIRNFQDNLLWKVKKQNYKSAKGFSLSRFLFLPGEPYSFWNWITQRDFGRSFLYGEKETYNRELIRGFCYDIVKYQKRSRLSFKVTGPSRLEYLLSIFPDAKFVWIKRNPLPNIRSLLKVDFYEDRKQELWWKGSVYSQEELEEVEKWKDQTELIAAIQYYKVHEIYQLEKEKLNLGNNLYEIKYEDFIKNSYSEIKKLLNFLNLQFHDNVKNYLNDKRIYNRNKKESFYISPDLDNLIQKVATSGIN